MTRALHGFLVLTGYYQKFIARYGSVTSPFTILLKRDAFSWMPKDDVAFIVLRKALVTAPLLQPPYFTKHFIIDYNTSDVRLV